MRDVALAPARDIEEDALEGVRASLAALPQRIQADAEGGAEHPQDADDHPAREELLAEHIPGPVHRHRPEDEERQRHEYGHVACDPRRFLQLRLLLGVFGDAVAALAGDQFEIDVRRGG